MSATPAADQALPTNPRKDVDAFFQESTEVVDGLVDAVRQRRLEEVHQLMQHLYLDAQGNGLHGVADACLRVDEVCQEGNDPRQVTPVLVDRVDDLFVALGDALDEHLDGITATSTVPSTGPDLQVS